MSTQVTFIPGQLGSAYCLTTFQQLNLDIISQLEGYISGNASFINFGNDTPDPEDRDKAWIRTIGGIYDKTYVFSDGYWASPCPNPGPNGERRIWTGTTVELATYDGGSAGVVTDYTGPMWEVDTTFEGRSPMGTVSTLPGTSIAFTVGTTYGEYNHTLIEAETPKHTHTPTPAAMEGSGAGDISPDVISSFGSGPQVNTLTLSYFGGDVNGNTTAHNTIHPVISTYFIKRTARKYYTV